MDDIFDVAGAESPGHPHPHPHHNPADHDHGEMGSEGKEEIGGEEDEGKQKATRKLWAKTIRDNRSSVRPSQGTKSSTTGLGEVIKMICVFLIISSLTTQESDASVTVKPR